MLNYEELEEIIEEITAKITLANRTVYVNSGLHCVETEIEEFASKYSAYNKCQMVNALLTDVVDKTTEKIEKRVQERKKLREKYRNDLEEKKQQLINTMRDKSVELDANFSNAAYQSINTYSKTHLDYNYPLEDLEKLNKKYIEENTNQYHIEDKKKDLDEAKGKMFSDLNWITEKQYKEKNCVVVEGYSAKRLSELSKFLDGEGAFMFLIELRENPKNALEKIANGFKMK